MQPFDVKNSDSDATMFVAPVMYPLSRFSTAYMKTGRINNRGTFSAAAIDAGGTVGPGPTQNGLMFGLRNIF